MHDLRKALEDIHTFMVSKNFTLNTRKFVGTAIEAVPRETECAALLNRAYLFVKSETEDLNESYVIGSILRRVVESHDTFNYGIEVEELFRNQDPASRLGSRFPYIKNAMYRLILNDESRLKGHVSTMNPPDRSGQFNYEGKRGCTQCILLMLHILDHTHAKRQLKNVSIVELQR